MRDNVIPECVGKLSFKDYTTAERSAARRFRGGKRPHKCFGEERLSPYRCSHCGHWHIGNTVRRKGDNVRTKRRR